MAPKEKARELCNKFLRTYKVNLHPPFNSAAQEAKQCALIAVDEIIKATEDCSIDCLSPSISYWEEVKQEIQNL